MKPSLNIWQIWNMCFGFLGIQFGFALQNANVSRIFQTLGAEIEQLPVLWVAAPVTGLVVQPIVGYMSDRTWNRFGRRRPYFMVGAVFASVALVAMPNAPTLWVAAGTLWIMDASINVSMEPFRAFVGDMLPEHQRTTGFAMQSFFIGIGAVVASALPWIMTNGLAVPNTAPPGQIPDSVRLSFYGGGAVLFLAVLWTVLRTREYPPQALAEFEGQHSSHGLSSAPSSRRSATAYRLGAAVCFAAGVGAWLAITATGLDKQLYILAGGLMAFGVLQFVVGVMVSMGRTDNGLHEIVHDLFHMPRVMRQLAVVQFFAWFALFAMWIYGTAAVTSHHYGTSDVTSAVYNNGADWVGVLFGAYNGFAAVAAMMIPPMVERLGCRLSHMINVVIGGGSLMSFFLIRSPELLLIPMVGVGIAWASILSLPYALLSSSLPSSKMGVYMGIFNFFIVIPQLIAASVLGLILRECFAGEAIYGLVIGGALMIASGVAVMQVDEGAEP